MKKVSLLIIALIANITVNAQTEEKDSVQVQPVKKELTQLQKDSLLLEMCDILDDIDFRVRRQNRYKMYPTENIYNLLMLDTSSGKIWQVQWSLESDKEMSVIINGERLTRLDYGCGTFELYPTKNMYQFILLNKINGQMWHVQWGMESSKRWIRAIY